MPSSNRPNTQDRAPDIAPAQSGIALILMCFCMTLSGVAAMISLSLGASWATGLAIYGFGFVVWLALMARMIFSSCRHPAARQPF